MATIGEGAVTLYLKSLDVNIIVTMLLNYQKGGKSILKLGRQPKGLEYRFCMQDSTSALPGKAKKEVGSGLRNLPCILETLI